VDRVVVTKTDLERRVGVSAHVLHERDDAAELLVHALAQLPDAIHATVPVPPGLRRRLEVLANAYQIDQRLKFAEPRVGASSLEDLLLEGRSIAEVVESLTSPEDEASSLADDDSLFAGHRVAVVTNVPTHYRVPLFSRMARRLAAAGAAFRVHFLSDVPAEREWMRTEPRDFDHEILKSFDLRRDRGRRLMPVNLAERLDDFRPTLLLAAGFSPLVGGRIAAYARRREIPFGVWSGEIASRPTAQGRVRGMQRKWIVDRAAFAVSYGWESARYLRSFRADLPVVIGRNTTPVGPARARPSAPKTLELLAVGRAEKGKALDVILAAVSKLADVSWRLTVIGDGPELSRLRQGADTRVRFLGARTPAEVLDAYSKADIFLFPSRYDIFGLVLVEAMGAGTSIVVARGVGAVADLAVDGVNALVIDDHDPHSWAEAIGLVARDHRLRLTLGENAEATIRRRWTIEHAADAMLAGLRLPLITGASATR
jgi:glycosyltransferase involved in cell wall biosynthesis